MRLAPFACALALPAIAAIKDWGVERSTYADPVTGIAVHNLTAAANGNTQNLYYHFSNFTADNTNIVFASDRSGSWQIYRSEAATGRVVQLTEAPGVAAAAACPHPKNAKLLYFHRGADVIELDIFTLAERRIGTVPLPHVGGFSQPTFSHDGRRLALSKQRDAATWEIGLMDLATGEWRSVITQGFRIGHVQHSPTDPLVFYVWETGGYAPQRSWIVNADGTGNRPFYYRADPKSWWTQLKEWMTHEAWVAATGRMTMVMDKVGIVEVEKDGTSRLLVNGNYWHVAASADGKWLVADDFQGRIWLIESATGNTRLLVTGIRESNRAVHGHASFDRTGRWILFNNGRTHNTVSIVQVP